MSTSRKVLITGIHSFTGYYLSREFEQAGWEVWGTGVADLGAQSNYYRLELADAAGLSKMVAKLRPNAVVHLAAISFIGHNDPGDFYKVNLIGTRNLLSALASVDESPECVLLPSSAQVYGNAVLDLLDESVSLAPASDYAVSKLAMECMARLWMDQLPIVITRPFNYVGIGQDSSFLIPKIVNHFMRRAKTIELGNLDVWRDFSDVRAVSEAYRRLVETRVSGEVLNVCSGITYSLREVISLAESISNHRIEVRVNPTFIRPNEVKTLCGDPSRLRKFIGFWETPPLEETLKWMLGANT